MLDVHLDPSGVSASSTVPEPSKDHCIQVILAEYNAMRSEILQSSTMQHSCLGFALALIGAALTVLAGAKDHPDSILLGASMALCCLGIVYLDFDSKILRIAHFIDHHLRPELERITGSKNVLNWERYFRGDFRPLPTRPTLLGKVGPTFESLFFFLPAFGFWLKGMIDMPHGMFVGAFRLLGFNLNIILLLYLAYAIGRGHDRTLPKRPRGVPPFLDMDEPSTVPSRHPPDILPKSN